jgi:DNA-binding PucR family transcriptional regulator
MRALLPLASGSPRELQAIDEGLAALGAELGVAIGRSEMLNGAAQSADGLREASDALAVARALLATGGALAYEQLGAYRYLVHVADGDAPHDPYLSAVRAIAAYDRRRGTQLVPTLEAYLADRRNASRTARALDIHPNTLRQRLERIEQLTDLKLAQADLLGLELAAKLARLRYHAET